MFSVAMWRDEAGIMVSSRIRLKIEDTVDGFTDNECIATIKLAQRAALLEELEAFLKRERAKDARE